MNTFFRKTLKHYNLPGHAHYLTFSCHKRMKLLTTDQTRQWFLRALQLACSKWNVGCWAYVIMPEHAHVLAYPRRETYEIENFVQTLKQSVAQKAINHFKRIRSPLLKKLEVSPGHYQFWLNSAGYDKNVVEERAIHEIIEYIHNNPVRRELALVQMDWWWSSARAWLLGIDEPIAIDRDVPRLMT